MRVDRDLLVGEILLAESSLGERKYFYASRKTTQKWKPVLLSVGRFCYLAFASLFYFLSE